MLTLPVRTCLADLMCIIYTQQELEIIFHKMNIRAAPYTKFGYAMDGTADILDVDGLGFIQKVVLDARKFNAQKGFVCEVILDKLADLERALATSMLIVVDENGVVLPVVEKSVKPDLDKKDYYLYVEMAKRKFKLTNQLYDRACVAFKHRNTQAYELFRVSLETLTHEIIRSKGKTPPSNFSDAVKQLSDSDVGVLKKTQNDEEIKAIDALHAMLLHYECHPEDVTDEVSNFLFLWILNSFTFILQRYELSKKTNAQQD
jgi:hypothetical protein